jgi:hypothetical protein
MRRRFAELDIRPPRQRKRLQINVTSRHSRSIVWTVMHRVLSLLVIVSASTACGASAATSGANAKEGDASVAESDGAAPCSEPPDARPPGATCVLEVKGTVEDLSGTPLDQLVMTFCGFECFGTQSNDAGAFTISPIGTFLPTNDYALHADGRPDHAVDYLRFTADEPSVITATMHLPTLPPSTVSLPPDGAPASSVTVGDLTLLVPDNTMFDLDIEDYGTTVGRILRVASVPLASAPGYATAAKVDAIYAIAPSSAKSRPDVDGGANLLVKMGVTLKNSAMLPASAAVDLMVLGDDYSSTPPNVGILAVAASAHVSADGQTIQTDPGEGISELTWLGVRRKEN